MNRKFLLVGFIPTFLAIVSCNNSENKTDSRNSDSIINTIESDSTDSNLESTKVFNPELLPNASAEMGEFPFFSIPDWLDTTFEYGFDKNNDFGKIEFYTGNSFYPLEGKIFVKGYNMKDKQNPKITGEWNEYKFVQSFSKHFESLGAKKLFEGVIPKEKIDELNKSNNKDSYFFDHGTASMENVVTYGVKKDNKVILFAIVFNQAYGTLYVGESEELIANNKTDLGKQPN